jgi:hypothetical protein
MFPCCGILKFICFVFFGEISKSFFCYHILYCFKFFFYLYRKIIQKNKHYEQVLETITFNSMALQQTVNFVPNVYSSEEMQLAAQYNMTVEQMLKTVAAAKLYPNVACDENGMPIGWYRSRMV